MGSLANQTTSLVPQTGDPNAWMRTATNWMLNANRGGLVATGQVTLTSNAPFTTVYDARVGVSSHIGFMPLTPTAALEAPNLLVTGQQAGTFVVAHAADPGTDRTYRYCIMG